MRFRVILVAGLLLGSCSDDDAGSPAVTSDGAAMDAPAPLPDAGAADAPQTDAAAVVPDAAPPPPLLERPPGSLERPPTSLPDDLKPPR